ncbi:shikimate kinase [Defluviitalea raffinosedens]|uniref:Shikimate kinase n=1 Tax=Defluviitalea raffinosedens TaxID=1450156 RepID=A0A7C8LEK2_9FIRM|nr:shikimate kinase [Defluviitalea raffinosedens]KAE9637241.1 shikimate kinase [Defluviitalea raffinosedens]MBM7685542.1 shikimate kinase [Defluviitalea raffinosedens]
MSKIKMSKNIVLIGFMGSGKSTTGKVLAQRIHYSFIDSDEFIESKIKMSISDYFIQYGEDQFRSLEEDIISQIALTSNTVIATGGGIVKNPNNILNLKSNGIIIYLKGSPEHIFERLKYDTTRPLLNTENKLETIKSLLKQRSPLYESASDIIIDIDNKSIDEVVVSILERMRGKAI